MKIKKVLVLSLVFATFALTSCNKDFVCDCHSDDPESTMEEREYDFNGKKSDAEEYCEGREDHLENDHGYTDVHCQLK